MDRAGTDWRVIFEQWPQDKPRRGMIVTTHQETVGFSDFRVGDGMLLLERDRPDSHGARKLILPWGGIYSLKLPDTSELSAYDTLGFHTEN